MAVLDGTSGRTDGKFLTDKTIPFINRIPGEISRRVLAPFADSLSVHDHEFVVCSLQHPYTSSCTVGMMTAWRGEFIRALKLYAPLNAVIYG